MNHKWHSVKHKNITETDICISCGHSNSKKNQRRNCGNEILSQYLERTPQFHRSNNKKNDKWIRVYVFHVQIHFRYHWLINGRASSYVTFYSRFDRSIERKKKLIKKELDVIISRRRSEGIIFVCGGKKRNKKVSKHTYDKRQATLLKSIRWLLRFDQLCSTFSSFGFYFHPYQACIHSSHSLRNQREKWDPDRNHGKQKE